MRPNLRKGVLAMAAVSGLLLAGCEANGGGQPGGGGNDGGGSAFDHCTFPFGPEAWAGFGFDSCLLCSGSNAGNVTDTDPATFGTINVTSALIGLGVLYVGFEEPALPDPNGPTFPAGNIAGFVISFPGLIEAAVLPDFVILTKLDNQTQEEFDFTGVVGADIAGAIDGAPFFLGVPTTKEFDAVEFQVKTDGVNLLNQINFYAACGNGDEQTTLPFILL
jgi:hypothetical protein